jgi:protease I
MRALFIFSFGMILYNYSYKKFTTVFCPLLLMEQTSHSFKIAILVADGFEQVELACPRKVLKQNGACVHIISPNKDLVKGWNQVDWGSNFRVDVPLNMARAEYYDALLLPGGIMSVDALRKERRAVEFVKAFFNAGKRVAAICHGPQLLIDADVVIGRKITSSSTIRIDLENAGALWHDKSIVVHNGLITSRKADDLPVFTSQLVKEFNLLTTQVN